MGDSGDDNRLVSAATIGQAGGISTALVAATGIGYQYTAATRTAGDSASGGDQLERHTQVFITLLVHYVVEEATS